MDYKEPEHLRQQLNDFSKQRVKIELAFRVALKLGQFCNVAHYTSSKAILNNLIILKEY